MSGALDAMEDAASTTAVPADDSLLELHELVLEQVALEEEVADTESDLKVKKEALRGIQEDKLPSKMAELGFQKFTTAEGFNITVKDKVSASITEANRPAAHEWLRGHGFGDLIKNEVTVKFPKGKESEAIEVMQAMDSAGHTAVRKEAVNAMTLKAFIKEQLEKGTNLPSTISVFPYSSATIKKP